LILLLAGVDLFMMMHPAAVQTIRDAMQRLSTPLQEPPEWIHDWVNVRA